MKSSEITREKIADAFCELASGKPISRISVREIAQKSGVTTVSFYHYFRDTFLVVDYESIGLFGRI